MGNVNEDIVNLIKAIKEQSGKQSKDLAAELGISANRMSMLTNQGDMKLSTFIRLLEVAGQSMEIAPMENGEVIRIVGTNRCHKCTYKETAELVYKAAADQLEKKEG